MQSLLKICRLSTSKKKYGGVIYELMIDEVFATNYQLDEFTFKLKGFLRLFEVPLYFLHQYKFTNKDNSILIRTFQSAFFSFKNPRRGITIIYHVDASHSPVLSYFFQKLNEWIFFSRKNYNENIVVIAEYWRDFFLKKGYKNIHLIYCGYDLEKYYVSDEQVKTFKNKYKIENRKIIYIGNRLRKKGADLVYNQLKDQFKNYLFVTTGETDLDIPTMHLKLSFEEYLILLKSSELVITMSQFLEGWNRVAHEAMLLGTPVVGSGAGGMKELLLNGQQLVCENISELNDKVSFALINRDLLSKKGFAYASKFSKEKFKNDWTNLITKISKNSSEEN